MKRVLPLVLLANGLLFSSANLAAVITNGSFENEAFSSWQTAGNTAVAGALPGAPSILPAAGVNQAVITSGDGSGADASYTAAGLATFLDLGAGGLSGLDPNAFRGSGIKQTLFAVNAGDLLTFSWNFLTNESTPSVNNDFGFFSLSRVGGAPTVQLLANTNSMFSAISNGDFAEQTGYLQGSFMFTVAGDYTLGFGAINSIDQFGSSALLIDNVAITSAAVPEPSSLALLMTALGGVALTLRRRRNRPS